MWPPRVWSPTFWLSSSLFGLSSRHATFLSVPCRFAPSLLKLVSGIHPSPCGCPSQSVSPAIVFSAAQLILFPRAGPSLVLRVGTPGKAPLPHALLVNLCLSWTGKRTLPVLVPGCQSVLHPPFPLRFPTSHPPRWKHRRRSTGLTPSRALVVALVLRERR